MDASSTAWLLMATGLVFLMLPGVALLEVGFARAKNAVSITMQVFTAAFATGVVFPLIGFSLAFGSDIGGLIGGLDLIGLNGIGPGVWPGTAVPALLYFAFQLMFAAVTIALVTGSIAERIHYKAFLGLALGMGVVYAFPAHWAWGGGWLHAIGEVDFAGSTVVHVTAGSAALASALMLGRRIGFGKPGLEGHNLPLGMLGCFLLWLGWFGFNGGSALAANEVAANALVTTNSAAAAGALVATVLTWAGLGKPSAVMAANGCLAGLVAVTAGAGYVSPLSALVIGGIGGAITFYAIGLIKQRLAIDDALDVSSIHGLPGLWGAVAVGIFADGRLDGVTGLLFGAGFGQLGVQALGAAVTAVFIFSAMSLLLFVLDRIIGLRPAIADEVLGLDIAEHREPAYS